MHKTGFYPTPPLSWRHADGNDEISNFPIHKNIIRLKKKTYVSIICLYVHPFAIFNWWILGSPLRFKKSKYMRIARNILFEFKPIINVNNIVSRMFCGKTFVFHKIIKRQTKDQKIKLSIQLWKMRWNQKFKNSQFNNIGFDGEREPSVSLLFRNTILILFF